LNTQNIRLGHNEAKLIFTLERDGRILFTFKHAQAVLATSNKSVYRVLDRLKAKRRIRQVRKGLYLLSPARSGIEGTWTEHVFTILTGILGNDYYVGFWSALGYWGMTEQLPQTTYVTVMKRARNLTFDNQRIQFVTYPRERFFDYTQEKLGETEFNISGREKTIVDSLAHPQYSGGISEVAKAIWTAKDKLDVARMIDDAEKMRILAVKLRLGYLLELLDFDIGVYSSLLPRKPTGTPWLDPSATKKVLGYSSRWGLKLNVPRNVILHWK
jgi:predicted transcriptional regulator of viral defense system